MFSAKKKQHLAGHQKLLGRLFKDGEMIIHEGDRAQNMFVIQRGKVEVFRTDSKLGEVSVAILEEGEIVGEMAFLDNQPRSASVRAHGDAWILTIDKRTLMRRVLEDPFLILKIFERMSSRVRNLNRKLVDQMVLFDQLSADHQITLHSLGNLAEAPPHQSEYQTKAYDLAYKITQHLQKQGKFKEDITPQFLACITNASLLYDVGNAGIDKNILEKQSELTPEEWQHVREHAVLGSRVLHKAAKIRGTENCLSMAAEIAEFHHERFDGKGYAGLKGTNIPLAARIMAVLDAYTAITAPRPYRPARQQQEAIVLIKKERGYQFDPDIVDAFLAIISA
ncbi:HD-GYP domain-containing protein [Magnetococcales bacterium HHB-1]